MSNVPTQPTSYEDVPYISNPYRESHPSHTASLAALFGMSPVSIDRARVLELGCAGGGNLLPIAEQFPGATFIGVDSSERQIADGEQTLGELGFGNVEF